MNEIKRAQQLKLLKEGNALLDKLEKQIKDIVETVKLDKAA